jgi:transcriptional regulator with XRE-family HTH domain
MGLIYYDQVSVLRISLCFVSLSTDHCSLFELSPQYNMSDLNGQPTSDAISVPISSHFHVLDKLAARVCMARSSYREQDYTFGQMMLSLRTNIGLTQESLAEFLAISRRAVGAWESGSKYPNPQHLKHLIALAIQQHAFPVGEEADHVRSLWHAARQKILLDERWLAGLLAFSATEIPSKVQSQHHDRRVDWGGALTILHFYGREWEQAQLAEWILQERCRAVGVLGLGGIGKSALSVRLMHQIEAQFDGVIWRSLRDSPTCKGLIDDCLRGIAPQPTEFATLDFEQSLSLLLQYMREQHVLIVLDNFESLLEEGETTGILQQGYEN